MFTKMLACLEAGDTQCAAREALDSQWSEETPRSGASLWPRYCSGSVPNVSMLARMNLAATWGTIALP